MTFLQASWRDLAMANYAIDPAILLPYLPTGTELDLFNDTCYASLVGFMFLDTRVLGIPIPFHVNFEEVNLRFYVRRKVNGEWRRGTVFIKEIVPRAAIAIVARTLYREPYVTMPMDHKITVENGLKTVEYRWKNGGIWQKFRVEASAEAIPMNIGSEPEFITEHYYGYTRWNAETTKEYEVQHPRWMVHPILNHQIEVDFGKLYGKKFESMNANPPVSVLLAEGSAIKVLGNQSA